ncbi:MAG: IS3 family transposase [Chloroflexota bacterium]
MSERHACDLVGIARSTYRYQAVPTEDEVELTTMIRDYAHRHPQYGYGLITGLLQADGIEVNHKRVERIWRREGLQ